MQTKYVVHSVYEIHQFDLAKPTHIENRNFVYAMECEN